MRILEMLIPMTIEGLKVTLGVFAVTLIFALPLAVVVALLRLSKNRLVSGITAGYIYVMRGTPLLLQLMFIFFGFGVIYTQMSKGPIYRECLGRRMVRAFETK